MQQSNSIPRLQAMAQDNAQLMTEVGVAISAISLLIEENNTRAAFENGGEFLTGYTVEGLTKAMELLAMQLQAKGDEYLQSMKVAP